MRATPAHLCDQYHHDAYRHLAAGRLERTPFEVARPSVTISLIHGPRRRFAQQLDRIATIEPLTSLINREWNHGVLTALPALSAFEMYIHI